MEKKNVFTSLKTYIQESVHELKKVTWPTKTQVRNYSLVVIALSIGVAVFFGVLDYVLNLGLAALIS